MLTVQFVNPSKWKFTVGAQEMFELLVQCMWLVSEY